jgi:hypothetical protein
MNDETNGTSMCEGDEEEGNDMGLDKFVPSKTGIIETLMNDETNGTSLCVGDEEEGNKIGFQKYVPSKTQTWRARGYLLLAALLYGTSFPLIKILDDNIPVGISLTLRFGLALLVTLPWLLENPRLDWNSSLRATLSGMELGMWDQAGFLTQALGMVTAKANKVSYIL